MKRHEPNLVALMLAISLLVSGLPIVSTNSNADSRPSYTLDICTPAQVTNHSSIQATAPLIPSPQSSFIPVLFGATETSVTLFEARFADPPIAPPPQFSLA